MERSTTTDAEPILSDNFGYRMGLREEQRQQQEATHLVFAGLLLNTFFSNPYESMTTTIYSAQMTFT